MDGGAGDVTRVKNKTVITLKTNTNVYFDSTNLAQTTETSLMRFGRGGGAA